MDDVKKNLIFRLNRVKGQIDGIIRMIEEGDDCQSVFQQFKAAYNALKSAGVDFVVDNINRCLSVEDKKRVEKLLKRVLED
ncbi:MAG: metal-sensitive transcriptional regulator [Brevinematia bacterium]